MIFYIALDILARIGMGLTGCGIYGVTIIPNGMMGDDGSIRAQNAAKRGLIASHLFAIAGVLGMFHCSFIPLKIALGVALSAIGYQTAAFVC